MTRRLPLATLVATPEHVDAFKALAHPGRLDVFFTLVKAKREMAVGDEVIIYHTGDEKACVGFARVVKAAYPDPKQKDPKLVVVDLEAGKPLARPVTLAEIKADPVFGDLALVRQGRLSVVPVPLPQWRHLVGLGARL